MRLIDADALKNDLITFFPDKCLEGITAKTLFRQILTDIDNAPTVPKGDLISREALKKKLQEHHNFFVNAWGGFKNLPPNDKARVDEITSCIAEVVNAPTVETEITEKQAILFLINNGWLVNHDKELRERWDRPQGEWKKIGEIGLAYKCNRCGEVDVVSTNFCPSCGAEMRKENDNGKS